MASLLLSFFRRVCISYTMVVVVLLYLSAIALIFRHNRASSTQHNGAAANNEGLLRLRRLAQRQLTSPENTTVIVFAYEDTHDKEQCGITVAILSLLSNTRHPLDVFIIIFLPPHVSLLPSLSSRLPAFNLSNQVLHNVIELEYEMPQAVRKRLSPARLDVHVNSPMNYIRFHFAELLEELHHILYLDYDIVVQGDVTTLWKTAIETARRWRSCILGAVPRAVALDDYINFDHELFSTLSSPYYGKFKRTPPTFNAGIMFINLDVWRMQNTTAQLYEWMALREKAFRENKGDIWRAGTNPPLLLVAYNKWFYLPKRWNVAALGHNKDADANSTESVIELSEAELLHWNGPFKPWLPNGYNRRVWLKYCLFDASCCSR